MDNYILTKRALKSREGPHRHWQSMSMGDEGCPVELFIVLITFKWGVFNALSKITPSLQSGLKYFQSGGQNTTIGAVLSKLVVLKSLNHLVCTRYWFYSQFLKENLKSLNSDEILSVVFNLSYPNCRLLMLVGASTFDTLTSKIKIKKNINFFIETLYLAVFKYL